MRIYRYCIIVGFLILLTGGGIALRHPPGWLAESDSDRLRERGREVILEVEDLIRRESSRSRLTPGLASIQAAWNMAKARHLISKTAIHNTGKNFTPADYDHLVKVAERLLTAESQSRAGNPEMPEEPGAKLRAYWSEVDNTLQTYSVTVPAVYDPDVKCPLIVSLHGHGWYRPFQGHPAPKYKGAFCVAPQGRGATDYKDLGEIDVLRSIEEVCTDFNIDRDRIVIKGNSMGGTGSWQLGTHYADRFAALLPIAGNADYTAWTERWGWNYPFQGRFDDLRSWIQESQTARAYAANLINLPAFVIHGSADTVVPPEHARYMVSELRSAGCPVEYREFPNCGHGGFPGLAVRDALAGACSHSRNAFPRHIVWKAALLRHGRAYWITMEQFEKPCAFGEIKATVIDNNHIVIRTGNLRRFSLERSKELLDPAKPLFLTVDSDRVIFPPLSSGGPDRVALEKLPSDGWVDRARLPSDERPRKRPGLEGPVHEAFMRPFVLVLGTNTDSSFIRELWRQQADLFLQEWKRRNGGECRIVSDTECTEHILSRFNVILFGGETDNSVSARIVPSLPLGQIRSLAAAGDGTLQNCPSARSSSGPPIPSGTAPESVENLMSPGDTDLLSGADFPAAGNREPTEGLEERSDVGLIAVYPNPLSPDRLAVLVDGNGPEAIYQLWQRFGNWFNWGVFDNKKYFDYAVFDAKTASPETFLVLGWFGTDWKIHTGIHRTGDPRLREINGPQLFPKLKSAVEAPASLNLVDLRPDKIDQMRGAVGFGRTYSGAPLEDSMGVRAPSFLEYRLDGVFSRLVTGVRLVRSADKALCMAREEKEKVRFTVKGDGVTLAQAEANWNTPDALIDVSFENVDLLRLEVHCTGGPKWLHGSAAWIKPVLLR